MEYRIVVYEDIEGDGVESLKRFIEDAEIIISDYNMAWTKDEIKCVGTSLRGATIEFKDGLMTHGYSVYSKLVKYSG